MTGKISQTFEVNIGVCQGGNLLLPLIFDISLEEAIQKLKNLDFGIRLGTKLNILAFAEDVVLTAENKQDLKNLVEILVGEAGCTV